MANSMCTRAGGSAGSKQNANRLYDPDIYHLSSQQSTHLSSKLMDLVYSNPWHPLARKHLTTASAFSTLPYGVAITSASVFHEHQCNT